MLRAPRTGDHVKASRDITCGVIDALSGTPTVRRGRRGIVREVEAGWWRTRCTVEFDQGWTTTTVRAVDATWLTRGLGHGEPAWDRRRDVRRGIKLGLLALNVPVLVMVGLYLLRGGDPVALAIGVLGALATMAGAVALAHPVLALAGVLGVVAIRRLRGARRG